MADWLDDLYDACPYDPDDPLPTREEWREARRAVAEQRRSEEPDRENLH